MKLLVLILIAVILFFAIRALTRKRSTDYVLDDCNSNGDAAGSEVNTHAGSEHHNNGTKSEGSGTSEGSTEQSRSPSGNAAMAASAAVAAAGVAAASGTKTAHASHSRQGSADLDDDTELSADATWLVGLETEDQLDDIQEMFKILNLRDSDAPRLGIEAETYNRLKSGDTSHLESKQLDEVADRLRNMFA